MTDLGDLPANDSIPDDGLTSPNNAVPRLLEATGASFSGGPSGGTYFISASDDSLVASGVDFTAGNVSWFWFDPAFYPVAGKTVTLVVELLVATNNTAPGVAFKAGLFSIATSGGGTNAQKFTLGTQRGGYTSPAFTPPANALTGAISANISAGSLTPGPHALALNLSASPVGASQSSVWLRLFAKHV